MYFLSNCSILKQIFFFYKDMHSVMCNVVKRSMNFSLQSHDHYHIWRVSDLWNVRKHTSNRILKRKSHSSHHNFASSSPTQYCSFDYNSVYLTIYYGVSSIVSHVSVISPCMVSEAASSHSVGYTCCNTALPPTPDLLLRTV